MSKRAAQTLRPPELGAASWSRTSMSRERRKWCLEAGDCVTEGVEDLDRLGQFLLSFALSTPSRRALFCGSQKKLNSISNAPIDLRFALSRADHQQSNGTTNNHTHEYRCREFGI